MCGVPCEGSGLGPNGLFGWCHVSCTCEPRVERVSSSAMRGVPCGMGEGRVSCREHVSVNMLCVSCDGEWCSQSRIGRV